MSIVYQVTPRQKSWIAGAEVVLDLRIENRTAGPFETPDPEQPGSTEPVFELSPPGGAAETFRAADRAGGRVPAPDAVLRLAPGETWSGDFVLSKYADLSRPGPYRLRSWIGQNGTQVEATPVEFEVVGAEVKDLGAETSRGEDGESVVECVQLLTGGRVMTSLLRERDPRNAELLPFKRAERGATATDASAILAPFANYSVGLSARRWIVAERPGGVEVGTNLTSKRMEVFTGGAPVRPLNPVATAAGLDLPGIRGAAHQAELVVAHVAAAGKELNADPVRTIEPLEGIPEAVAATASPASAGNLLAFLLANSAEEGTRVRVLVTGEDGRVRTRTEQLLRGWKAAGPAALAWSSTGEILGVVLGQDPRDSRRFAAVRIRLDAELRESGPPSAGEPLLLTGDLTDARVACFEQETGRLSAVAVLRSGDGRAWLVPAEGQPRETATALPRSGPFALLPGLTHWYAVWAEGTALKAAAL